MKRLLMLGVLALIGTLGLATPPAQADGIDFTSASGGGTISYNGKSTGALLGSMIPITQVAFTNEAAHGVSGYTCGSGSSTFACGLLSFTTGALVSKSSTQYVFGSGGSLTVSGMVPGGSGVVTLVSAMFAGPVTVTKLSGNLWVMTGAITVTAADASLVHLFRGLSVPATGAATSLVQMKFRIGSTGKFSGTAESPDVFVPASPVPEPASMLLLGSGLAAVARKLRQRKSAS